MASKVIISKTNPVKLVEMNKDFIPQYLTKHFNQYLLAEQLKDMPFVENTKYCQIFQNSDTIKIQVSSDYSPISLNLIDKKGKVVASVVFSNIGLNIYEPAFYTYEAQMSLATIAKGCYFLKLIAGTTTTKVFVSEPISIKQKHPRSILFSYRNSRYKDDIIYETGIAFQFRVQGEIVYARTASKRYGYEGQNSSRKLLNATNQEVYKLGIGHAEGVPGWIENKVTKIMDHNEVMIDGTYFTGFEDFKIEQKTEDGTWMRGLSMEVVEGINRSSEVYLFEADSNYGLVIIHQVDDSVIFGDLKSNSNNTIPISSIN